VRCSRYGSFWIELDEAIARLAPKLPRELEVRPAAAADLPAVYRIAHQAFAEAYMFAPISPAEFASLYGRGPAGTTSFVCDGGFVYGFVTELDDAPVGVIKTIAVEPAARARGAYHALLSTAFAAFRARGARRAIGALIHTDGAPALMGWQRGEAFKRYALYEHA
jgi:L-amino acid N-acyltransferase YncA